MGNMMTSDNKAVLCVNKQEEAELWPYLWAMREAGECLDWKRGLTPSEIESCFIRQADLPVTITDTLFLSDRKGACDIEKLRFLGVTLVLNVAGPAARGPVEDYRRAEIAYREVDADDEEGYDMLGRHLEECLACIEETARNGGKTVIHCVAGINRSGVIAAAVHLLAAARTHPADASILSTVQDCRRQRGNCFLWNNSFQLQLALLARQYQLLGPLPGQPGSPVTAEAPPHTQYQNSTSPAKSIKNLF
jgi:hypothetical protein